MENERLETGSLVRSHLQWPKEEMVWVRNRGRGNAEKLHMIELLDMVAEEEEKAPEKSHQSRSGGGGSVAILKVVPWRRDHMDAV